ncbi:MAG: hypothetical protein A4E65_02334 [Syntrophorhabdus sp. PtaU1.Bin153]|nr:MAG: hypothetical protein A4E65_02334 [Syntrophorhabdus sp. PtaU1.Bin153]
MTPVMQTKFGAIGNCFEACLASLLNMSIERVPNFGAYGDEGDWMAEVNEWLSQMGLAYFEARIPNDEIDDFFRDKDFFHVMVGHTNRFEHLQHAIVGRKGKMVHDPHPDGVGILPTREMLIGVVVRTFL